MSIVEQACSIHLTQGQIPSIFSQSIDKLQFSQIVSALIKRINDQRSLQLSTLLNLLHQNIELVDDSHKQLVQQYFEQMSHNSSQFYKYNNLKCNYEVLAALLKVQHNEDLQLFVLREAEVPAKRIVLDILKQTSDIELINTIETINDASIHLQVQRLHEFFSMTENIKRQKLIQTVAHCFLFSPNIAIRKHFLQYFILQQPKKSLLTEEFIQFSLFPALKETKLLEMHKFFESITILNKLSQLKGEPTFIQEITSQNKQEYELESQTNLLNSNILYNLKITHPNLFQNLAYIDPQVIFLVSLQSYLQNFDIFKISIQNVFLSAPVVQLIVNLYVMQKDDAQLESKQSKLTQIQSLLKGLGVELRQELVQQFAHLCCECQSVHLLASFINELNINIKYEQKPNSLEEKLVCVALGNKIDNIFQLQQTQNELNYVLSLNLNVVTKLCQLEKTPLDIYKMHSENNSKVQISQYLQNLGNFQSLETFIQTFQFCTKDVLDIYFEVIRLNKQHLTPDLLKQVFSLQNKHTSVAQADLYKQILSFSDKFSTREFIPEILAYCQKNMQLTAYIFCEYTTTDFEIALTLATFTTNEAFETTSTFYVKNTNSSISDGLKHNFVNSELNLNLRFVQCIWNMLETNCYDEQLLIKAMTLVQNAKSIVYADQQTQIFNSKANQFTLNSLNYKKQVKTFKIFRLIANKIVIKNQSALMQLIEDVKQPLNNPSWLRSSREMVEQTLTELILKLADPSAYITQLLSDSNSKVVQLSAHIIAGLVIVRMKKADEEIVGRLIAGSMGSNHQIRFVSKQILQQIQVQNIYKLDKAIVTALNQTQLEIPGMSLDNLITLMSVPFTCVMDVIYNQARPTVLPFVLNRDAVYFSYEQILQATQDEQYVSKLQSEISIYSAQKSVPEAKPVSESELVAVPSHQKKFQPTSASVFPLIVVASLLDNEVNLGGIARTCEIFKAETLYLSSLSLMSTPQFISASVTASNHLNIQQLQQQDLKSKLLELKSAGYQIVCLEQSQRSIYLNQVQLPEKAVILLGNETRGVPDEFLKICDLAVEIPQFGQVRSLNVHVSAALIIWEWVRQRGFE
ncbi:tRNA_guanosine-2'-O-methyltransferase [Hexamita inflata]|uniref:tRNA guanosine-2'-O-methyltransferase n=1 Tax=Hexamita inflata TaxID=28002 RepID=A0AA86PE92_9EUKA|nr:tRNA guanosine-2'-O-methyltransferase [Hexamita inflata]